MIFLNATFNSLLEDSDREGYSVEQPYFQPKHLRGNKVFDFDQEADPEDYSTPEGDFARAYHDHVVVPSRGGQSPFASHADFLDNLRGIISHHSGAVTGLTHPKKGIGSIPAGDLMNAAKDAYERRASLVQKYRTKPKLQSPSMQGFLKKHAPHLVGEWINVTYRQLLEQENLPPFQSRIPTSEMQAAYHHGRTHASVGDLMSLAYSKHAPPEHWWENPTLSTFWDAGYEGAPMPKWVRAERYGSIPKYGQSRNHAENSPERGVSVSRIVAGHDDPYRWHMGGFGSFSRKKTALEGWLHHRRGSDGEPLLVGAVPVGTNQEKA